MKALVLTNHLSDFGGSEIIAVEVAEALGRFGYDVDISANLVAEPMRSEIARLGLNVSDNEVFPSPFDYNLVWVQHNVLSSALFDRRIPSAWTTYFVFVHLSPYEPLETPGPIAEEIFADQILANSKETRDHLLSLGISEDKIDVFFNAAPAGFRSAEAELSSAPLRRVAIVSNHMPDEIQEAAGILRNRFGLDVAHFGIGGCIKRITPGDIQRADAIISIGKTCQYAIVSSRPVYCYDQFGGPGWLSQNNFEAAEYYNFSGRCCRTKRSGEQIARDFVDNFQNASSFARQLSHQVKNRYELDFYIQKITESAIKKHSATEKLQPSITDRDAALLQREARLLRGLRQNYRGVHLARDGLIAAQRECADLKTQIVAHQVQLATKTSEIVDLEAKLDACSRAVSDRDTQLKLSQRNADARGVQIRKLEARLLATSARLQRVLEQEQMLLRSASWRVTKPLRFLRQLLR